jgi:NADP-dependent 3-hydroxy acid dehydrogenase YdfG
MWRHVDSPHIQCDCSVAPCLIIACARPVADAQKARKSLSRQAIPVACKLFEPSSVRECVRNLLETKRSLDVLLCNAVSEELLAKR